MKSLAVALLIAGALGPAPAAWAAGAAENSASGSSAESQYAQGEVRNINKETGRVTLRHGPLPNLGMPPMTMVFRVKDPRMLDTLKIGDKVEFVAEQAGGALTIVALKPAG